MGYRLISSNLQAMFPDSILADIFCAGYQFPCPQLLSSFPTQFYLPLVICELLVFWLRQLLFFLELVVLILIVSGCLDHRWPSLMFHSRSSTDFLFVFFSVNSVLSSALIALCFGVKLRVICLIFVNISLVSFLCECCSISSHMSFRYLFLSFLHRCVMSLLSSV